MANEFNVLPEQPFDGQVFIDAFRIKWIYDGSVNCWRNAGTVPDIPVATELQTGLLSAKLKQLLDSVPEKGGHFGIIAQPLLSLVPQNPKVVKKDTVHTIEKTESGTQLVGASSAERAFEPEQYTGKILVFKSGILKKKAFLVFTNDATKIFLEGDATAASRDDEYEIVNMSDLNPSGILLGDIMLVSNSIDITCVDGEGLPVVGDGGCNIDYIKCDDVTTNPPGLNFQINQDFIDSFCVTIPGCKGPKGDRGDSGPDGDPGTGDGPQGEQGDPGQDAPAIANTFSGIKIIDIDDIFDTAVVAMELDAEAGKLNIIRAKVRTPDDDTPATQIITTPVTRSLTFTDEDTFDYQINQPNIDPIGEADINLLKYPNRFDGFGSDETNINRLKLSDLVDSVIGYYETKLAEINDDYNRQLKAYIEEKDAAAREILGDLAMKVAECEFELPIDFCIGLTPNCSPVDGSLGFKSDDEKFSYPYGSLFFGSTITNGFAFDLGALSVPGTTADEVGVDGTVSIKFPIQDGTVDAAGNIGTTLLPPGGYVIQWTGGTITSSATDFLVGDPTLGVGLEAIATDGPNPPVVFKMPVPSTPFNAQESSSVEFAYQEAFLTEKVMAISLTQGGTISLKANLPGVNAVGSISLRVIQVIYE
jgi:hypothetical protein